LIARSPTFTLVEASTIAQGPLLAFRPLKAPEQGFESLRENVDDPIILINGTNA